MWLLRLFPLLFLLAVSATNTNDTHLINRLLTGYNRKIRPVKVESTVTQVVVFLNIAHVEKVDEQEQTALVHGHLWASWTDEYMMWDRTKNNITKVSIPSTRLWQPALALYNSARGNTWHLYMNGLPSTVYFNGKVWSSGTFSFFVTCQFDYTNWPFDVQTCPIVIADWVYGLAQVNLSDPNNLGEYAKPSIRMSYDPINPKNKRHVGGWEVLDSWKKHCYWGPQGCKENQPEGEPDWYWSLLEFGIILKRHVPYYFITVIVPLFSTISMLIVTFWNDHCYSAIMMNLGNLAAQATYAWNILRQLPPGSGGVPKIVELYVLTLVLTCLQGFLIFVTYALEERLPKKFALNFGFDITALPRSFGIERFFVKQDVISFAPGDILNQSLPGFIIEIINAPDGGGVPLDDALGLVNPVHEEPEPLINLPTNSEPIYNMDEGSEHVGMEDAQPTVIPEKKEERQLTVQLVHIKRYLCLVTIISYFLTAIWIIIF